MKENPVQLNPLNKQCASTISFNTWCWGFSSLSGQATREKISVDNSQQWYKHLYQLLSGSLCSMTRNSNLHMGILFSVKILPLASERGSLPTTTANLVLFTMTSLCRAFFFSLTWLNFCWQINEDVWNILILMSSWTCGTKPKGFLRKPGYQLTSLCS